MGQITLQGVQKSFGPVHIIKGADLDIADGSFVVFVGPSGCGKTTLLRLIAGLEDVTGGAILIDGRNVVDVPPAKRGLSMVFQSYALYPHMSVRGNIAFGLKMAGIAKDEINRKVEAAAATLNLTPYLDRKPRELSGGQQQRVALARALAIRPSVLLLDEPLSALDAKVRVQLRDEIRKVQLEVGTTTLFVTHDQEEALEVANRVVVMDKGKIEQIGSPGEVYDNPATAFVHGFIGESIVLPVDVAGDAVRLDGRPLNIPALGAASGAAKLFVRRHDMAVGPAGAGALEGAIRHVRSFGPIQRAEVTLSGSEGKTVIEIDAPRDRELQAGEIVSLQPRRYRIFAAQD